MANNSWIAFPPQDWTEYLDGDAPVWDEDLTDEEVETKEAAIAAQQEPAKSETWRYTQKGRLRDLEQKTRALREHLGRKSS